MRHNAISAVDHQLTLMYWHVSKSIFEEEQEGKECAEPGTFLMKYLSEQLQSEFGSGQINHYHKFYPSFENMHVLRAQWSWTHYKLFLSFDS